MATLPSGLPCVVDDEESLARFLVHRDQFSASIPKPSAFLPNRNDRETSVFRHGREPLEQLWAIGSAAASGRNIYGAAIIKAHAVRATGLTIDADEPPPRHAAIRNWSWNDADSILQKAQQKEKALVLASQSELVLC